MGPAPATAEGRAKEEPKKPEPATPLEVLQGALSLLEKAVNMRDVRLITGRLLRQTAAARKRLSAELLAAFAGAALPEGNESRARVLAALSQVRR